MSALSTSSQPFASSDHDTPNILTRLQRFRRSYIFRVVIQGILTILAVITFTFFLIRLMPGNPVEIKMTQLMLSQNLTMDEARAMASTMFNYDPNEPVLQQYIQYMTKLFQGDLGRSIVSETPILTLIAGYLPWTLFSVGMGLLISFVLGVTLGILTAYWRGGILDNVVTAIASVLYGVPDYVIALLLIMIGGVQLKLFPLAEMLGGSTPGIEPGFRLDYILDLLVHAFLPVTTYVLATVGGWILTMKSSTLATLGEDYITVARARGLPESRLLTAYVGRNAMLPLVTRLAISVGIAVSGSVIIEFLFSYPGLGLNLSRAIGQRDYTVMQGIFLVTTIAVVTSNIFADLLLGWLDPRIRLGKEEGE
jgi:peptide/nickel transport system permease protein